MIDCDALTDDDDIELSNTPVDLDVDVDEGVETAVTITTMPRSVGTPLMALASMRRARRSEHEEVWAQLFIDGVFIDVTRAAEVDSGSDHEHVTFVGRFSVPLLHLDGDPHRARVCFVTAISRIVARSEGSEEARREPSPQAVAEVDFTGRITGRIARRRAS